MLGILPSRGFLILFSLPPTRCAARKESPHTNTCQQRQPRFLANPRQRPRGSLEVQGRNLRTKNEAICCPVWSDVGKPRSKKLQHAGGENRRRPEKLSRGERPGTLMPRPWNKHTFSHFMSPDCCTTLGPPAQPPGPLSPHSPAELLAGEQAAGVSVA